MPSNNIISFVQLTLPQWRTLITNLSVTLPSGITIPYDPDHYVYMVEDNMQSMTQAEYDALATKDPDIYYFIED